MVDLIWNLHQIEGNGLKAKMTNLHADLFADEVIWWRWAMKWKDTKWKEDNTVKQNNVSKDTVEVSDITQSNAYTQH